MGKGRAPCCHKGHVNRGPWSPEEDLRLISFVRKYGHDNWMALPKKAGLLRCGKSCRLRWINYLRPGLKRGNFTKEEEKTIMRLHQSFGNKWAMIAAELPGRTDNEIKNIWNTRLKKKLAQKPVGCLEDVTKGSPVITSSSLATVESSQNYQINELDYCQINMLPHNVSTMKTAEMESSRTIFALNQSSMANQGAGLQDTELSNTFCSTLQHSGQPLDSKGINQPEDSAIWEDPIFLEPLLDIDEDPNWLWPSLSTQNDPTEKTSSYKLRLKPDFDLRSMLNDVMPASPKPDDKDTNKVHIVEVEAPMSETSINAAHEDYTGKKLTACSRRWRMSQH